MIIKRLTISNVKRITAVDIVPDDSGLVVLGGRNAQGKSSVLDSIQYLMDGGRSIPEEPLHRGADKGFVAAEVGDYIGDPVLKIRRTFTASGGGTLTITSADGLKYPGPQAILDKITGDLTFDPCVFMRADRSTQEAMFLGALGLDLTEIDERERTVYAERTDVNRELARAKAATATLAASLPDPLPAPVDVSGLAEALQAATEENAALRRRAEELMKIGPLILTVERSMKEITDEIERLRGVLAEKGQAWTDLKERKETLAAQVATDVPLDTQSIRAQIAGAEAVQQVLQRHQTATEHQAEAERLQDLSDDLTDKIVAAQRERRQAIAAADLGIEGLEYDGTRILFMGFPLEQASQAEAIRVSMAIGMRANPKLTALLFRDASLLDPDNMAAVRAQVEAEAAKGNKYQVWMERVGTDDNTTVVIEDGTVLEEADPEANDEEHDG